MAVRYSISAPILIQKPVSTIRPVCRLLVKANNNHVAVNITSLQINGSSSHRMKVFEDQSEGIVCYRDSNGEITCEGYDEGPRFQQQISRFTCNTRDTKIVDLLQSWLEMVDDDDEFNKGDKGVNGHKDINFNGFNTFC